MLAFVFLPGLGIVVYIPFGRDTKAFSKQSRLLMQDLAAHARPLLSPIVDRQDTEIAALEGAGPAYRRLLQLVRHNCGPCSRRATASTSFRTRRRSTRA